MTDTITILQRILQRVDRGHSVKNTAVLLDLPPAQVMRIFQRHRPDLAHGIRPPSPARHRNLCFSFLDDAE